MTWLPVARGGERGLVLSVGCYRDRIVLPHHLVTPRMCLHCPLTYRPRGNTEVGLWDLMARHARNIHDIRAYDWHSDGSGGHCKLCWRRVQPGGVLQHWRVYHDYAAWTKMEDFSGPTAVLNSEPAVSVLIALTAPAVRTALMPQLQPLLDAGYDTPLDISA